MQKCGVNASRHILKIKAMKGRFGLEIAYDEFQDLHTREIVEVFLLPGPIGIKCQYHPMRDRSQRKFVSKETTTIRYLYLKTHTPSVS